MRFHQAVILLILFSLGLAMTAQSESEFVTIQTADGVSLAGDFYPSAEKSAPLIIALHMLNSNRSAYERSIIPDLQAAGYAVLNVDLRGHGDSGGGGGGGWGGGGLTGTWRLTMRPTGSTGWRQMSILASAVWS